MIPPWSATVNRLPAHQGFPFPAVYIPACGGTIPPCGAVCVPFWNAIYKVSFFERFCIPAPVIGGLLFAIISCILFLIVPVVGGIILDFMNSILITFFINVIG